MPRFPPPPKSDLPREYPSATVAFDDEKIRPMKSTVDAPGAPLPLDDIESSSDEEEGVEMDYLTEQFLQDKKIFQEREEMYDHIPEIDTTTVDARNIISLVLRPDIPYMQRRIVTLLAKTIAEQSMEFKVDRTHDIDTSMTTNTEGNPNAPDFSCQINIQSKNDFIKRQNDKRRGYIPTPLANPLNNFNAELYFKTIDNMYSVRPGKPVIRSIKQQQQQQQSVNSPDELTPSPIGTLPQEPKFDPYNAISEGTDLNNPENAQDTVQNDSLYQKMFELEEQAAKTAEPVPNRNQNNTFLLPTGLGMVRDPNTFSDINALIAEGTSESCTNDWSESSVSGLPVGHMLLHSTITQSTHMLMTNALSPLPTLILYVADVQSLGRGRSNNNWVSPPGCLMYNFSMKVLNSAFLPFVQYFSSWVTVRSLRFALQHCCECSHCRATHLHNKIHTLKNKKLAKSLKLEAEATQRLLAEHPDDNTIIEACMDKVDIAIKWPNDIYVDGKKVSGTMLSCVCDLQPNGGCTFAAHLGTGLNVSNGAANGNKEFSTQYEQFLTINDSIMASYQAQLTKCFQRRRVFDAKVSGIELKEVHDDEGIEDDPTLPPLLDQEDMDFLLLQEQQLTETIEREAEINKLVGIESDNDEDEDEDDNQGEVAHDIDALKSNTLQQLPLLTKEIVLAALTLYISLALPHFNQFGFGPFQKDYYSWWLHEKQIISIYTSATGNSTEKKFQIKGIDNENGYLLAIDLTHPDPNSPDATVELHPDSHSFDMKTMTIKPKVVNTPTEKGEIEKKTE